MAEQGAASPLFRYNVERNGKTQSAGEMKRQKQPTGKCGAQHIEIKRNVLRSTDRSALHIAVPVRLIFF